MIRLSYKLYWNTVPTKYFLSFNMVRSISLVQISGTRPWDTAPLDPGPMWRISTLTVIYCPNDPLTSGAPNVQYTTRRNRHTNLLMAHDSRNYSTLSTLILWVHSKSNPWDVRNIWYPWLIISLDMPRSISHLRNLRQVEYSKLSVKRSRSKRIDILDPFIEIKEASI